MTAKIRSFKYKTDLVSCLVRSLPFRNIVSSVIRAKFDIRYTVTYACIKCIQDVPNEINIHNAMSQIFEFLIFLYISAMHQMLIVDKNYINRFI